MLVLQTGLSGQSVRSVAVPDLSGLSDTELVAHARSGSAAAFDVLFTRHKDEIYGCLWNLLNGDNELVEEAVGAVFLAAYRNLSRFRGDAAFSTWLYRIAINEASNKRREKRRWLQFAVPLRFWRDHQIAEEQTRATVTEHPDEDPLSQVILHDSRHRLRSAVHHLPEPYRTPVILRYLQGMNSVEIAAVLERPAGTIRHQLHRALQLLRERLAEEAL